MELILHGLAGCTGIDIISILTKMRLEVRSFYMEVEGTRADDHPKRFTDIHIHYVLEGDLPEDKVVRAMVKSKLLCKFPFDRQHGPDDLTYGR